MTTSSGSRGTSNGSLLVALLLALALGLVGWAWRGTTNDPARPGGGSGAPTTSAQATVAIADLPPQAGETLARIADGGPFRYPRDGAVFQNRERRLPMQRPGYYREYTVLTPGSPDRGARRIVTGAQGERYYSGDHYRTFRLIRGAP